MDAKIVEHTQAFDRKGEDGPPKRIPLERGNMVSTKNEKKGEKDKPDTKCVKLPASEIFLLCDAGKAMPNTREDLEFYRRRGKKAQTVAEETAG